MTITIVAIVILVIAYKNYDSLERDLRIIFLGDPNRGRAIIFAGIMLAGLFRYENPTFLSPDAFLASLVESYNPKPEPRSVSLFGSGNCAKRVDYFLSKECTKAFFSVVSECDTTKDNLRIAFPAIKYMLTQNESIAHAYLLGSQSLVIEKMPESDWNTVITDTHMILYGIRYTIEPPESL